MLPLLIATTALAGATHFVASTSAVVRAAPRDDARAVVTLDIGASVDVLGPASPDGAWVRVVAGPRVFRYDDLGGEPVAVAPRTFDARMPTGFVRTRDLAIASPVRKALLAARADDAAAALRVWALDPHDPDARVRAKVATPRRLTRARERAPAERADLVFGCAGDLARATVVGSTVERLGAARPPALASDVCVAALDVRAPCGSAGAAALAEHKAAMTRVVPRFGNDGPALRLVVGPGASERPVWIVMRTVQVDGCNACAPTASTSDVKAVRLRVPLVEHGTALLHVQVPRATGVIYDVVFADDVDDLALDHESFELPEDPASFSDDPRAEPGAGTHVYAAPDVCGCACDDDAAGEAVGDGADEPGRDVDDAP